MTTSLPGLCCESVKHAKLTFHEDTIETEAS